MADHAHDGGDDNIFVYMGGSVPQRLRYTITHVRVHKSVKIITTHAFRLCRNLVSVEMHDDVEIIEGKAFYSCHSLRRIKLTVRVIGMEAFYGCTALTEMEFGDKLETIGDSAFYCCISLRNIKIPKIRSIGNFVFSNCLQLTDVELSEDLERIGERAFNKCPHFRRIAMPLKENLLENDVVFVECHELSQVDLIGGIHKTVSSLLLDSWRNEMNNEIDGINQVLLPNTFHLNKTAVIQQWMRSVIRRIEHYKNEHYALLKEFTTLLELALWKAKLDEEFGEALIKGDNTTAKKAKIDTKTARQEQRITSGANIVIKNVLPFLKLE